MDPKEEEEEEEEEEKHHDDHHVSEDNDDDYEEEEDEEASFLTNKAGRQEKIIRSSDCCTFLWWRIFKQLLWGTVLAGLVMEVIPSSWYSDIIPTLPGSCVKEPRQQYYGGLIYEGKGNLVNLFVPSLQEVDEGHHYILVVESRRVRKLPLPNRKNSTDEACELVYDSSRNISVAAYDEASHYLVLADDQELITLNVASKRRLKVVSRQKLVQVNGQKTASACAFGVMVENSTKFVCGPNTDFSRFFAVYDLVASRRKRQVSLSDRAYTYEGIPMKKVPGHSAFTTVTIGSNPTDFKLFGTRGGKVTFISDSPYHGRFPISNVYTFTGGYPATHLVTHQGLLLRIFEPNSTQCQPRSTCLLRDGELGVVDTFSKNTGYFQMTQDRNGSRVFGLVGPRDSSRLYCPRGRCMLQEVDVGNRILTRHSPELTRRHEGYREQGLTLVHDPFDDTILLGGNLGSGDGYEILKIELSPVAPSSPPVDTIGTSITPEPSTTAPPDSTEVSIALSNSSTDEPLEPFELIAEGYGDLVGIFGGSCWSDEEPYLIVVDSLSVRKILLNNKTSTQTMYYYASPRNITVAAYHEGSCYLAVADRGKVVGLNVTTLEVVSSQNLVESCISGVIILGEDNSIMFACGPNTDWDRIITVYDIVGGTQVFQSAKGIHQGLWMKTIPGRDAFLTVSNGVYIFTTTKGKVTYKGESPLSPSDLFVSNVHAFTGGLPATHISNHQGVLLRIFNESDGSTCLLRDGELGILDKNTQLQGGYTQMTQDHEARRIFGLLTSWDDFGQTPDSICSIGCLLQEIHVEDRLVIRRSLKLVQEYQRRGITLFHDPFDDTVMLGGKLVGQDKYEIRRMAWDTNYNSRK